ncbi:dihydrofolate reductase family protein [Microbacterium chocolatum]|uniref:dihydrofolate reductase family protein n=1 Tax=Microbacterium aurantiacum TaxID=162393 RepID=UPI00338F360A
MARELVYTGFITLDGSVDSPGGAVEGHPGGGWVFDTEFVEDAFALKGEELADTTALLFGRRSYQAFAPFWRESEDHAAYRDLPKFVVSTTLADDDLVDGWGETIILRSLDDVRALTQTDGGAIFVHGSAELARHLGEADLIDRYNLLMFPYLLPGGKNLFGDASTDRSGAHVDRRTLSLRESEAYSNGVVKLVYDVRR